MRLVESRLPPKCGAGAVRQGLWDSGGSAPIFQPDPFHADKIPLKRGLKKRPGRGRNGFD